MNTYMEKLPVILNNLLITAKIFFVPVPSENMLRVTQLLVEAAPDWQRNRKNRSLYCYEAPGVQIWFNASLFCSMHGTYVSKEKLQVCYIVGGICIGAVSNEKMSCIQIYTYHQVQMFLDIPLAQEVQKQL